MSREYNDYDFQSFEDIYSDSNKRNAERNASHGRIGGNASDRNARRRNDAYSRNVSDPYAEHGQERHFREERNSQPYGEHRREKRSSSGGRHAKTHRYKKGMRRSVRRALIISAALLIVFILIMGIIAIAGGFSGVGDVGDLTISEIADNSLVLSWQKVDNAKGYRIYYRESGSKEDTEYETVNDPDTLSLTVSGLDQATEYVFTVAAFNDKGEGEKKVSSDETFTLPQAPAIFDLSSPETGVIHVEWESNPKCDGYVVEYHQSGESDYSSYQVDDRDTASADLSDLDIGETYGVRVYAFVNDNGKKVNGQAGEEQTIEVAQEEADAAPKAETPKLDSGIDPEKPMIAFSFDDGPTGSKSCDRILDILEENNVKATFFMVGWYASQNPDNVKRKADLGMELGNHTWDHTHYSDEVTTDDIRRCSDMIYELTGQYPTAFRSPGGMTTDSILNECGEENMPVYRWSIDTKDWESRDADKIYDAVMDNVSDGDIILMHEIYDSTADAVEKLVPELKAKGYQIVTCYDLIRTKTGEDPVAGTEYFSARESD